MNDPSAAFHPATRAELEQLMMRYQAADAAATADLISAVSPSLYRFFLHDPESRADVADLLRETWLRIHKSRQTYRPGEPVLPWLYGIARHVQIDAYRRRKARVREQSMEVLPELPSEKSSAPRLPVFQEIIARLPKGQREVVIMLKATGMSLAEVADATGSSVRAVKQKAHRAYQNLRQILRAKAEARKA